MSSSTQEDDSNTIFKSHNIIHLQTLQKTPNFIQNKMEEFLEQVVSNSSYLIVYFMLQYNCYKNMNVHMIVLVHEL